MNSATKGILRAMVFDYNLNPKRRADALKSVKSKHEELSKSTWIKVRNSSDQNHFGAYALFLRIFNKTEKMESHKIKEVNHSERAHALLSASGASRWINCTPSPRLEENFPNNSSIYAEEGTLAHEFAELNLKKQLKLINSAEWDKVSQPHREHQFYSEEMIDHVQKHVDYVIQQFTEAKRITKDAVLLIEQKVNFSHLVELGFGTCDVIIIADGVLEVIDLKFGQGIRVDATENSQLKLYGIGALEMYDLMYDIHTVRLTITQPRMDAISSWELSTDDIRKWGQEIVKPKALEAYSGSGEQNAGDWCKFCKASPRCKAQADKALELAKLDFEDPQLLTDEQLIDIYKKIPNINTWFGKVSEYLYTEALNGKKWPEHKLVDGQNRRGWTDEDAASNILSANDFFTEDYLTKPKLKGIGDIEKLVGKKVFPTLLGDVVAFKKTSPSLVHESDKRPALGLDQAKADFAEDL